MSAMDQVHNKIKADMDKIEELEKKKDYDSAITVLKDQITFLEGYLTGEKNQALADVLYAILRDRRVLMRVFKTAKQLEALEKSTDDRIANLVHKVSQIEKEFQIKKEGK